MKKSVSSERSENTHAYTSVAEPKLTEEEAEMEREQMGKPLRNLIEIMRFTENVSAKIHGLLDEAGIYRTVKEEFAKSKWYNASILLLTEDGSKLRFAETSLSSKKVKAGEKAIGLRSYKSYRVDLNKSSFFNQVIREGKTIEVDFIDVVAELFPRPLAYLLTKIIGYEKRSGILTPLKRHGKIIGILVIDSTELAEHFIPSVKNLVHHISTALELADEYTKRRKTEDALKKSEEKFWGVVEAAVDGVWFIDAKGKTTFVNDTMAKMLGYSKKEMIGKSVLRFTPQEEAKRFNELFERRMKGIREIHEFIFRKKNGQTINCRVSTSPIYEGNQVVGAFAFVQDVTERKKAEEALVESEEKFRSLVQTIPECVYSALPNGEILYMSPAVETIFGYFAEEMRKDKNLWIKLIHKDDKKQLLAKLEALLKEGEPYIHEFRMKRKDGNIVWIRDHATTVLDEKGKPVRISGIIHNVTERKKTEQELIRLSEAVKMSTDSIVISDTDAKIIDVNEATLKMYGTDNKGDLIGKNSFDLIVPDEREKALAGMKEVLEKGYVKSREYHIVTKDGRRIPVDMSVATMKDTDGKPIGFVGISRDISQRKRTEEALRESEEKFRNIFENASDCMAFLDSSGRILEVNRKAVEVFGGSREEVLGKHFTKIGVISARDIPRIMSAFANVLAGKKPAVTTCIKNKKGQEIHVEVSASLMKTDDELVGILVIARDITEKKKGEERIRESEEKYRTLLEEAPIGICYVDIKGKITYVNKRFEEATGYSREEVVGKNGFKLGMFTHESVRIFEDRIKRTLMGKRAGPVETQFRCKDGRWIWVHIDARLIKKKGIPVGFQLVSRDITDRKKAEEAIRKSEEKYRGLVELAPDGILTIDMKGVMTSVNNAFSKLTGYSRDEIVGKHFKKLRTIRKRDIPKCIKLFSSFFRGKIPQPIEFVYLRKDGTARWCEARASLVQTGGKTTGGQVILRDITERKKMEEKLKQYSERLEELVQKRTEELLESEKRYSVVVEEASDGVVIIQDEKIVLANKKASGIIGYSRDELIGLPFEKIIDEKYRQDAKERCIRRIRGEVPSTYEMELIARTDERIPVEVSCARIRYQGRYAIIQIVRDMRERKRMEEQHLKLEKLATIGELATMVAHDLRNPLTSIRNAVYYNRNLCPHRAEPECKTAIEMLDIVEQGTIVANNIVNDLLDFAATRPLQKKRKNINKVIETSLAAANIPENIKIKRKLAKEPIATVDTEQLERVFLNLVKNTVQAMSKGGKLTVKTSETRDHIEIAFTDTGAGIPKENMSKLFQPLFTTKAKGIGMGLAICKKIVEQHGGTIEAESKVGKGTTFTIKLPKKGGK